MDAGGFIRAAVATTGLSDFGGDDFMAGLGVAASELEHSNLAPGLAQSLSGSIAANLEKRLKFIAAWRAKPEVAGEVIERPLFVIGLPRTGTTALVDLLAQDPAARAPLQWETANLNELNDKATWADDPRIEALETQLQAMSQVNPIVALGLHSYGARLPDECNGFMAMTFWSPNVAVIGHLPRYREWLRFASAQGAFGFHKRVLQHLQHNGRGGRWTLKSPFHVFDLPGILATYPDAIFVQTHRDPLQLLPSMCGLYSTIRGEAAGDPGRAETGRELAELWGAGLQRGIAARLDPALDARVFDMSHRALLQDPLGAVRSIYEQFDLPFGAEAEARMRGWIDAPAQHMSSVKFTLDEFGLDEAMVNAAFGPYRERFGAFF